MKLRLNCDGTIAGSTIVDATGRVLCIQSVDFRIDAKTGECRGSLVAVDRDHDRVEIALARGLTMDFEVDRDPEGDGFAAARTSRVIDRLTE